ncbi:gas vesicle protein GvpO, halophile-type [Natrarchaeobaculum aegyptiacum]|uniref:Gas vesicle protein n=1 Tax=Natrarchaeobaculum aegyptiacum TaxID=745377 RepID=A0A2Z2HNH1_9EURY|nr:gas vesicle protein [Natrarchaeobaculum aegyptiacum]ARS88441.1 gas vesicle protein [Natrarchaeobaculum aegyptiacum]
MAEADTNDSTDQCVALTESGERCSRPATEGGFCFQHDESDPTVSETETESAQSESEHESEAQSDEAEQESQHRSRSLDGVDMTAEEKTDPESVDADEDVDADESIEGVLAVRRTVEATAGELIGQEFDSVTEIVPTEDGWRAIVDVIERRSVPDTQDVMGRYEVELDEDATVHGYRRLDRYRRGDTAAFE